MNIQQKLTIPFKNLERFALNYYPFLYIKQPKALILKVNYQNERFPCDYYQNGADKNYSVNKTRFDYEGFRVNPEVICTV